jgi:hypothetical protein
VGAQPTVIRRSPSKTLARTGYQALVKCDSSRSSIGGQCQSSVATWFFGVPFTFALVLEEALTFLPSTALR